MFLSLVLASLIVAYTPKPELVIYTYDSLSAVDGLGAEIFSLFEKNCSCSVKVLSVGGAGELMNRLHIDAERKKPVAHVAVGLDQHYWERVKPLVDTWSDWTPARYEKIKKEIHIEKGFLPFDYGVFAFMADTAALKEKKLSSPKNLSELLQAKWHRNILIEDPRSSAPGLAFLLFTEEALVNGSQKFWGTFKNQWLTLAPSWTAAYNLFLKKEAPLVWSYTTSQAYHESHGDTEKRYRALLLEEGQPLQIEGAVILKQASASPETLRLARKFMEFLISKEVQNKIPKGNWMFPAASDADLPQEFKDLPQPKRVYNLKASSARTKEILDRWNQIVSTR